MTNHNPVFTSSSATGSFTETANTTDSLALHLLSGTMNFTDSDHSDTHTTLATLGSAVLSSGSIIPASSLAHFQAAMTSQITSDSNGSGKLKWSFSDADDDFDFLSKDQTLVLTYNIKVSDNHGGSVTQTVKITVTGTDDKPVINMVPLATVTEQANHTLSLSPDTAHVTLNFVDDDLTNTGHTASVTAVSASGTTSGILPGSLGTAELMAFFHVDSVVKNSGSSAGTINTTFSAPDLAFDYLAAGEQLNLTYTVQLDDHAGGVSTQNVMVTVVGTNDAPIYISGPQSAHLVENQNISPAGDLTAHGDLFFTDVDLSDTHTVSTTVTATRSGGGSIPLSDAALLAAFTPSLEDSTGHVIGEADWAFALQNNATSFLSDGEILTLTYHVAVIDPSGATAIQDVTVTILGKDSLTVNPVVGVAADTAAQDTGNFIASGNVITDAGDTGDPSAVLTVSEVNGDPGNVGSFVAGTYGDLLVFSDGTYLYQAHANVDPLQLGDHPTDAFNFTVTDGLGHSHSTTLTLTVQGADDAPVITSADVLGSLAEDAGPTVAVNGGFESGDLTGWSSSGVTAAGLFIGGQFGNYAARLAGSGFLEQDPTTTAGQHYTLSFYVAGDSEATATSFTAFWDGAQILAVTDATAGFTHYTFDVVGDASNPTTQLLFDFSGDGTGMFVDQVSITPTPGPATETTSGSIAFSDVETADTHVASFTPQSGGFVGTFSLDPVSESGGNGTVAWHFSVDNADIQFLAQGQTLIQTYTVIVTDDHGAVTQQDVTIAIDGSNDAPTAVGETIISDAGANGSIAIPKWALAANDTDPDTTDHVSFNSVASSTDGTAIPFGGDVVFIDDATPGGSFTYNSTDGIATSGNHATATVINNAATATTLTGTSGDDILIATNGTEALVGGDGNDILIGNAGSHTMTGGTGNDSFAFLHTTDGPGIITDFNNVTEHDHIVIAANGFGGGLTAGMDVTSLFETSGDDQFSGSGAEFHFDTANQTLYYSSDGTQASAIAVTSVQAGVVLNPHDLLIV